MIMHRHTKEWWVEPHLPNHRIRIPSRLRNVDPVNSDEKLPPLYKSKIGIFGPSKKWANFSDLDPIDIGYLVPAYTLSDIAKRYRLTHNSKIYFRKYILPEPFDIVRRRSVNAHHWSRFVLMAMDVVLKDLEAKGHYRFHKKYVDHINLIETGAEWMADHYERKFDDVYETGDQYGVTWHD